MSIRRLRTTCASLLVALVATGLAAQALANDAASILGSWRATVTAEAPPGLSPLEPLRSLITFSPGGGVVESRRLLAQSPFGALIGTTGHGEWIQHDDDVFEVKFVFLQQSLDTGAFVGTDTVHLELRFERLGPGTCALSGRFESVVREPGGFEMRSGAFSDDAAVKFSYERFRASRPRRPAAVRGLQS